MDADDTVVEKTEVSPCPHRGEKDKWNAIDYRRLKEKYQLNSTWRPRQNPEKKIKALIDGKIHNLEQLNISIIESGLKIYKKS